eukprot:1195828-Prorocentrum_minimum.AAC.13
MAAHRDYNLCHRRVTYVSRHCQPFSRRRLWWHTCTATPPTVSPTSRNIADSSPVPIHAALDL